MKKIVMIIICLLFTVSCKKQEITTSNITASAYIVVEQSSNKILEGYNYDAQRSVASISKIMTAILAIENLPLDKKVIVSGDIKKAYGSSIYLKEGQLVTVEKLLYGLMLRSGNDAAIMLAVCVSNTVEQFVELMNQKAKQLNLLNTYFSNPHGLDEEDNGNISTAYDMAILYSYCAENEVFNTITSSKSFDTFTNKNRLLKSYKYCTGGKTGFTKKAKRTLITSASKDNINLIIVTLNCGNDFESHKSKYEYYFNNYQSIKVLNKGQNYFDNYCIDIKKDYYFITNLSDLNLFYEIKSKQKTINITLFDKNKNVVDYLQVQY